MKYEIFENCREIEEVWKQSQSSNDYSLYLFQTFEWLQHYRDCFGDAFVRFVLFYDSEGAISMLLPLSLKSKWGIKKLEILGGDVSDYLSPIVKSDTNWDPLEVEKNAVEIARTLRVDIIEFRKMPKLIEGVSNPFWFKDCRPEIANGWYLHLTGTLETLLEARFSKKHRYNLKRGEDKIKEMGALEFKIADNQEESESITKCMILQKSKKYVKTEVRNAFLLKSFIDFYSNENRSLNAFTHISALKLGNKVITTHWGACFRKRFYYLMPTFDLDDQNMLKYSPGKVHLTKLIDWCYQNEVKTFDFTIGSEGYKKDWCDQTLELAQWIRPVSLKGRLFSFIHWVEKVVRSNKFLFEMGRRLKRIYNSSANDKRTH